MQKKILLLVIAMILVVLVSIGMVSYLTVHQSVKQSLDEHLTLASLLGKNIDYILERNITRLYDISFSGRVDLDDGEWSPERAALRTAYEYSIFSDGLFLTDLDGNVLVRYPHKDDGMINLLGNPYIYSALHSGNTVVSDIYTLEHTSRKLIFVLVPLTDINGNVVGLAGGEVNPANYLFTWVIRSLHLNDSTRVELIDSHGIIISSNDPERILTSSDHEQYMGSLIDAKEPRVVRCHRCHTGVTGRPTREADMMSFAPLSFAPWGVTVREPEDLVFAPTTQLQKAFIIVGLIVIATAVLLSVGLSRSIVVPLIALRRASERIATGDLSERVVVTSGDEVGELAEVFESMRHKLAVSLEHIHRHTEELEERVEKRTMELNRRKQQLSFLVEEGMRTQEDERMRIARELHDETGQALAALGMSLEVAALALAEGNLGPNQVMELRSNVGALMDGINRLIHDLRPPMLDELGLEAAIRWLLRRHLEERDIKYTLKVEGLDGTEMDHRTELGFFRLVQEAVINITKHSKADMVRMDLACKDGLMRGEVSDDGVGFDLEEMNRMRESGSEHGFGILGMVERVTNMDGEIEITTAPGKGTRILIRIPLKGGVTDGRNQNTDS